MNPSTPLNATILKKEVFTENLFTFTIKTDFPLPDFKAGQFTTLGLPGASPRFGTHPDPKPITDPQKLIRRSYSILSSPLKKNHLEFYVALVPEGLLTPRLFLLEEGNRVHVGEKFVGKFTLDQIPAHKHLLMISTGTGVTPFISMLRTHQLENQPRHCVLVHGVRHSTDLTYHAELATRERQSKNIHYIPAVSRPQFDPYWNGPKGRIPDVIRKGAVEEKTGFKLTPDNFDVLLCGNPGMIEDITSYLKDFGFAPDKPGEPGQIHKEEYW